MNERLVLNPPNIVDVDGNVIFLAGPIQGAPNWQSEAADIIHGMDSSVVVVSPRKDYEPGTFVYEKQVDWETHFLRLAGKSGVIAFWLANQTVPTPGRAYAQTTGKELFEWKVLHKFTGARMTVGMEEGFGNERYIRRRFEQDIPDVKIATSLFEVCKNAVELLVV